MRRIRWSAAVLLVGACGALVACGGAETEGDSAEVVEAASPEVTIEYIAHASFIFSNEVGDRVLIDPYQSRVWLGYDFPEDITADAVLVTHPHYDHDAGVFRGAEWPWPGTPRIDSPGPHTVGSIEVEGVEGKHADPYGMEFGQINTMFVIEIDGLRIAHWGDNGPLTEDNVAALGRVDVLMLPGDGVYHIIDAETTEAAITALQPRVIIPMHYRIGALEIAPDKPEDLGDVDVWLEGRSNVERVGSNVLRLRVDDLPAERTIMVMEHSPRVTRPS